MTEIREALKALLSLTDEAIDEIGHNAEATCGGIHEPGLSIDFYGPCPVQGTGEADGHPIYYRARDGGSLEVYAPGTDVSSTEPIWSTEFDADGWDEAEVTKENIRAAVALWREHQMAVLA
jgi:hypothetical protein